MGLYDRDYYREPEYNPLGDVRPKSVVMILIMINVAIWVFQMILAPINKGAPYEVFKEIFVGSTTGVFDHYYLWQPFTACFLHNDSVQSGAMGAISHLALNMFFLFWFGRQIEHYLGKAKFLVFYLGAGAFGMMFHLTILHLFGSGGSVIGASAATIGIFVFYTLLHPNKKLMVPFTLVSFPIWWLCVFMLSVDLLFSLVPSRSGVAHLAHLGGALFAFLYWYLPSRFILTGPNSVWSFKRKNSSKTRTPNQTKEAKILAFTKPSQESEVIDHEAGPLVEAMPSADPEVEQISNRIDELLDKISQSGQDSLSSEELEFLKENSGKYKSRR